MGMTQQGIEGEQLLFKYLHNKGIIFFQPDGIGLDKDNYVLYEVKNKAEPFYPPPFLGHGLEIRQVNARLNFQKKTGIRCKFIVFETKSNVICQQWLDELEKGEHFDTAKGIRIYPIDNFDIEFLEPPPIGRPAGEVLKTIN